MKNIKNDIKTKQFQPVYLIHGDEKYLVRHYEKELLTALAPGSSADRFEGKGCPPEDIIFAADSLPFLTERRVIHVKDSGLFTAGGKDASEKIADYLANIPETTVIVFVEGDVDKRGKLYKKVNELKRAVEMNALDERELITWVTQMFRQVGFAMEPSLASFFIRYVGGDMDNLFQETEKLIAFKTGTDSRVEKEDIENICTKSKESKIFDLVAAIGNKNPKTALDIYANLLLMKESPLMVLSMIARQFRIILECGHLTKKGMNPNDIAQKLGLRGFIVRDCAGQSRNFTEPALVQALTDCLETDIAVKTGKMTDKLAVELLIIEYASRSVSKPNREN